MKGDFSAYSAETLLAMFREEEASKRSFSYEAGETLLKRWRQGLDLEVLIELLQSKITSDRCTGAYFLREIGGPVDGLRAPVIKLANDELRTCRWSFVYFMLESGYYDEEIAIGLAKCLRDFDLVVRKSVIEWGVYMTDDCFEDFSNKVKSGVGARDSQYSNPENTALWTESDRSRAARGLDIIRRLRNEEPVAAVRKSMSEEDNFVFDSLQFFEKTLKRWIERRKSQSAER
ncbi:hypothetical protein [Rhizobium sp. LjRoot254]|uniref:hypothetical protein n=1 Tax=Rhizobium sp. LjRoot254 TaxID=3342297 RepID=UPI003ECFA452